MEKCNINEGFISYNEVPITFIVMTSVQERVDNINKIIKNYLYILMVIKEIHMTIKVF